MPYVILLCDDDPDIRGAMRRTLRGNEIVESGSPREAIDALKLRTFDAIISDYSLEAESDGLDVLQHVRLQYPDVVRFLVTGNKDLEVVVRALNEGAVDRYFMKPWDDVKFRAALELLLRARR